MSMGAWPYRALVALGAVGLSLYAYSVLALEEFKVANLAWGLVFLVPMYGVGVLAYSRRPDLPIAKILVLGGSTYAAFSGVLHLSFSAVNRDTAHGLLVVGALLGLVLGGAAAAGLLGALDSDGAPYGHAVYVGDLYVSPART